MPVSKTFDASLIEKKWYNHWLNNQYFEANPDQREAFSVVIPPPNVTGILHMGHILNNTIQDVLVRRARMKGKNVCWVPGTDHASIATEAKVVQKLRKEGIKKSDLKRAEFINHAMQWTNQYGGVILDQLKKMGASCAWNRTRFTLEDKLSQSVIDAFIELYKKGFLYRGLRMINWDIKAQTALSNEEVIYKEEISKLYHIKYFIEGEDSYLTVATTRPETLLGDTAICVHPKDTRYSTYKGKKVLLPLCQRSIPIISDEYVDKTFGTGVLKITPAHDSNDYDLGIKHKLPIINIFNPDGTVNEQSQAYQGLERFEARKRIVEDLEKQGYLEKVEEINNKIGYSERTHVVVEPRLSKQWFLDMKQIAKPALEAVMRDEIKFYPPKYKNVYKHWMENIRDWCISRQLWWGQQIPVYYYGTEEHQYVVASSLKEALQLAREKSHNMHLSEKDLKQDEDVVDTWFSSWLWPISVFDGFDKTDTSDFDYYYPTSVLVTGWDIIFLWVARMIMAGYTFKGKIPFKEVYFTGMVRDKQRRKMSKSLGNSPNALDLINQYGADGVRFGVLSSAPAGGDLLFDEKLCEQGRNFSNKMWNALRLIKGWEIDDQLSCPHQIAIEWFESKLNEVILQQEISFKTYRLSESLINLYNFIWTDFCSWFLEMVKPHYEEPIDKFTYQKCIDLYEQITQLIHPYMPFISEEIWSKLQTREKGKDLTISKYPTVKKINKPILEKGNIAIEIIRKIREIRAKFGIKNKEKIEVSFVSTMHTYKDFTPTIIKCAGLEHFKANTAPPSEHMPSFIVQGDTFFVHTGIAVNIDEEKKNIQKEIDYTTGFLQSVEKKLSNERFIQNAPKNVIDREQKKRTDALSKINALKERLKKLDTSSC